MIPLVIEVRNVIRGAVDQLRQQGLHFFDQSLIQFLGRLNAGCRHVFKHHCQATLEVTGFNTLNLQILEIWHTCNRKSLVFPYRQRIHQSGQFEIAAYNVRAKLTAELEYGRG